MLTGSFRLQVAGYRLPVTSFPFRGLQLPELEAKARCLETGNRKLVTLLQWTDPDISKARRIIMVLQYQWLFITMLFIGSNTNVLRTAP